MGSYKRDRKLMNVFKRKIFLSRYFFNLENFSRECKEKYEDNPKKAIRHLMWWNFKQSLKIFTKSHANDYWEPYVDMAYRGVTGQKVIFPYEQIKKDSKIVLYGVNESSRQLIKQNNITGYCKIIGVVDDSSTCIEQEMESVPIIFSIPEIKEFDYLIISYLDKCEQEKVFERLISICFPMNKAIFDIKEVKVQKKIVVDSRVRICVIVTGGLGDYIIEKRTIIELQKIDSNSIFFITSEDLRKKDFLDAVYFDMDRSIISYENENEICYSEYDLVMRLDHIIHILYADINKLRTKSKGYYDFAQKWIGEYDRIKENNPRIPFESVIHVNRAKILKLDRYGIMASYTALSIADHKVPISVKSEYRKDFKILELPERYITLNFGADSRPDGRMQVKTWPIDNYNALIRLIKEEYPDIKIVQIGNKNSPKMRGADAYVFDCHIETIKYVLKESQLHIDCEG